MSEIDRLYSYRSLLSGRRAVPRDEILRTLEVSLATFKRDLTKLRDRLHVPIVFDRDLGGYRLEKTGGREELPGLWFSQEELLALLTIQHMIGQLEPGILGPKLKPLQQRLDDMLSSQGLDWTACNFDCVPPGQEGEACSTHARGACWRCCRNSSSNGCT